MSPPRFSLIGSLLCWLGWHKWTKPKLGGVTHLHERFYIRCCNRLWCYKTQYRFDWFDPNREWVDGKIDERFISHHSTGASPLPKLNDGTITMTTTLTIGEPAKPIIGLTDEEKGPPSYD